MQIVTQHPRSESDWEKWYEAVTQSGLIKEYHRDRNGRLDWFVTRTIDSENALDVAEALGLSGSTVSELSAHFRNLGATVEQILPIGSGITAKFSRSNF